jgi:hypothetical protein
VARLLEEIRRANFIRMTGSAVQLPPADPGRLLGPGNSTAGL